MLEYILDLIDKKHEGSFWDYKECYYMDNANLLHDIICMANNQTNNDGLIIFGVTDTGELVGVDNDPDKKSQQNIIDFLSSKTFLGEFRPTIELKSFTIYNKQIDVLVIKNDANTPYILKERYKSINSNYVYTRIGDTNTPINKTADINHVEFLWKKRFGIVPNPLKRFETYITNKDGWSNQQYNCYYIEHPEFTIKIDDERDKGNREFYSYMMMNKSTTFAVIELCYFSTVLIHRQVVWLDSGRYMTSCPEWGSIAYQEYNQTPLMYKYFIEDTIEYKLHKFLLDENSHEAVHAHRRFMELVLLFKSNHERKEFEAYAVRNISQILGEVKEEEVNNLVHESRTENERRHENHQIHLSIILKKHLDLIRNSNI